MNICLVYFNLQERVKQFLVEMIFSNSEFYKEYIDMFLVSTKGNIYIYIL